MDSSFQYHPHPSPVTKKEDYPSSSSFKQHSNVQPEDAFLARVIANYIFSGRDSSGKFDCVVSCILRYMENESLAADDILGPRAIKSSQSAFDITKELSECDSIELKPVIVYRIKSFFSFFEQ